jgi:hypothetical protein
MAFLPPALMIAGTLFSGVSDLGQGLYKAQVAKNNAVIATQNANAASEAAQIKQMRSDREYAAMRGNYLSETASNGVDLGGGSQGAVLGLIDRNRTEAGTDIRRTGQAQSTDFLNKGAFYRGEAASARASGISSMIGSVLKAGGQAYGAFSSGGSGLGPSTTRRAYPWSQ